MNEEILTPEIVVGYYPFINYTFCLNKYNFLQEIEVHNLPENTENIKVEVSSSLDIIKEYQVFIDKPIDGKIIVSKFDFQFNLSLLRNLTEKDVDNINIKISTGNIELQTKQIALDVLPMDYFGGLQVLPQLLCSYVIPNHPTIYEIKTKAIEILENNNLSPSFEGYQRKDKERVVQMVSAIYKAIQNQEFIYSAMPPSFESHGQRIRLVDQVWQTKFGNCIDLSLLFAACLEAISLHPIIIITKGHAFVGVWIEDKRFDTMVNFDQAAISKRIASGTKEIALIESTNLCKGNNIPFSKAVANAEVELMNLDDFILSIDVKSCRSNGIFPLPTVKSEDVLSKESNQLESDSNFTLDEEFEFGNVYDSLELTDLSNLTKQKIWERKLLDLSLRNNLLNIRFTKSMLQIVDLKINLLEDTLADGKTYTIHPNDNQPITRKYGNYIAPLHSSLPLFKLADEEFKYNRLLTTYHSDDLETILTNLYRSSKLAEEENGKSTLYLGLGLLKWFDSKAKTIPRFAPILLVPVELSRKSANTKYTLRSREEETMINITLVEYLKQEYKLNLNALENLPMDESGVDVGKVLAIIRNAIMNLEGWDVMEQIVLGIFSFNKLILWQDISKYSEEIQKSSIVKSLIEGKLSASLESVESDDAALENLPAALLTLPISADNSQLNAVKNANLNKTFILHGPPGTGKSQTITNIIADALANGKKVLFVAAKKAALDVVHHRLESIGLSPFTLELHSNKSKKSDVLQQFERTLDVPKYQLNRDFVLEGGRLDERKKELNKFVTQLHHKNNIGWSIFDSLSFIEINEITFKNELKLSIDIDQLDEQQWNEWLDWLKPFSAVAAKIGQPSQHPLKSVKLTAHRYESKSNLSTSIEEYIHCSQKASAVFQQYLLAEKDITLFVPVISFIKANKIRPILFDFIFDKEKNRTLKFWLSENEKHAEIESHILSNFNKSILKFDSENWNFQWNQSKHAWFFPKWLKQRKIKAQLQGFAKIKLSSEQDIDQIFTQLETYKAVLNNLSDTKYQQFGSLYNAYFSSEKLNIDAIEKDLENIVKLQELLQLSNVADSESWIKHNFITENIDKNIDAPLSLSQKLEEARNHLSTFLYSIGDKDELEVINASLPKLEDWINYNIFKFKADKLNLHWFIEKLEQGIFDTGNIEIEFYKILHLNNFIQGINAKEILNRFDASVYESMIHQYKDLHKEFIEISKNKLIVQLSSNIPNFNQEAVQSSEIGILQKAIRSKGRGLSIRKLFDQIPTLIPRLKPCMLMSPISVAQYFNVNQDHFDLVIFDEASQLPTSESISALARAKQAIIVGDPKQMPPTSFFASSKTDEDNYELEDLESILDDCLALSIPSNYLLRHYRSKHESLISFSNKHFYDSKLLTFPSPDDLNQKVTFEFVKGFYDKGKTRTNIHEAEAIVNYIKTHLTTKNEKSLGVVTFSQIQQNLIEDLLQKMFQENPLLDEYAMQLVESIFIKNLENVQGDERDIILFSIGYGPDESGKVSMNFGPLNRDGGWRRLNVAVTRARYEMKIFSSLIGDQIDLNRTKSEGVKGLKDFLNFAQKGNLPLKNLENTISNSSLVDSIADSLQHKGLHIKKNIGTSNYKVDIGIIHPNNEKEYVLGILLDGENYYHIHTTNDRELLAPGVLKSLGWDIFRIWSLDWIKNKEQIVANILCLIEEIINRPKVENDTVLDNKIEHENTSITDQPLLEITDEVANCSKIPYTCAQLEPLPFANSETIYYPENRVYLLNQIKELVNIEAPISKNYLQKKILKLWNTARAGNKLSNFLTEIVYSIPGIQKINSHQEFYWSGEITPSSLDHYRDNSEEKRTIDDIAPEEIKVAIMEIMNANLSLNRSDLVRLTARIFDYLKVGTQIDLIINLTINRIVSDGLLKSSNDKILVC
ncbi:DUF3320 domain-containing protein [Rhizosphaericola mali]|uniref:DUF3320 domain-containing protein n=1 Tax=Rhizosphaericola mali TaxID=2545455 RepID=A0A5P2G6T9_9BACT|nr:DUF3320 domain-containing protein [Rhizosphaericola mali]QES89652.1 DUF3320 domain-containing protein [Rhizosphaericola mali]